MGFEFVESYRCFIKLCSLTHMYVRVCMHVLKRQQYVLLKHIF